MKKNNPQSDVALAIAAQALLGKEARNSNAALSPVSIQAMLSLIAAGAAKGPALDKLLSFLKAKSIDNLNSLSSKLISDVLNSSNDGGPKVSFANGIWVDESLPPLTRSFKKVASNVYGAESRQVDFQNQAGKVVDEVNEWAKQHTNGIIKQVLSPSDLTASTRLVLANALYFKGAWAHNDFDPKTTKFRDFHLMDGTQTTVRVPFMTTRTNQYIRQFDGFKVLSLPYKTFRKRKMLSMYIFLPDSRAGLPALVHKMGSESGFVDHHRPWDIVEVGEFWIPKFKISFGFEASDVLKEMGLDLDGVDLSGMVEEDCGGVPLGVSSVLHKAFVEVNEQGTEAAAVTVTRLMISDKPRKLEKMDFAAEHPFVFLIRDDHTGTVLFVGQVLDPSGETEDASRTKRKLEPEVGDQDKRKKKKNSTLIG